jgi:hypothetical protein
MSPVVLPEIFENLRLRGVRDQLTGLGLEIL